MLVTLDDGLWCRVYDDKSPEYVAALQEFIQKQNRRIVELETENRQLIKAYEELDDELVSAEQYVRDRT